jgi:hypothetical protein
VFREGALVTALRQGHWLVLDELNLAPTEVLEALNRWVRSDMLHRVERSGIVQASVLQSGQLFELRFVWNWTVWYWMSDA